jgi:hypothetical protein
LRQQRLGLIERHLLDRDRDLRVLLLEGADHGLEGVALGAGPVGDDAQLTADRLGRLPGRRRRGGAAEGERRGCTDGERFADEAPQRHPMTMHRGTPYLSH